MCFHIPPLHTVLLCFRHHGYQEHNFSKTHAPSDHFNALWIYNLEGPLLQPRGTRGLHYRTPYFQVMEKELRCKVMHKDFVERQRKHLGGRGLLWAHVPGWFCFIYSPSLPASDFSALRGTTSVLACSILEQLQVTETPKPTRGRCRSGADLDLLKRESAFWWAGPKSLHFNKLG